MNGDDINGTAHWWSDAVRDDEPGNVLPQASFMGGMSKDKIAEWRAERRPLPKSRGQARKDVGRALHEFDSDLCGICATPIDIALAFPHPGSLQLDHIYPLAGYGRNTWDNIQLAHAHCNVLKSSYVDGYPRHEEAAETLRIAVAHWDDLSKLEADLNAVGERWMDVHSRHTAMVAELEQLSATDPLREARREAELSHLYVEREALQKTLMLYLNRLRAHRRRAQRAGSTRAETDG